MHVATTCFLLENVLNYHFDMFLPIIKNIKIEIFGMFCGIAFIKKDHMFLCSYVPQKKFHRMEALKI